MIRIKVKRWKMCQYCKRTIFKGELAFKIKGAQYYICEGCQRKEVRK